MNAYDFLGKNDKKETIVSINDIRTDGGTQYRGYLSDNVVIEYSTAMKEGDEFPPIETVFDGQFHWVVDGFHRLAALSRIGVVTAKVTFVDGTLDEAKVLALSSNRFHGLQRDTSTKLKIGMAAIRNPLLKDKSQYEISKITGLSQPFIKSLRDPDAKLRQQEAREKSVMRKIKQEVTNPISIEELTAGMYPDEFEIALANNVDAAQRRFMYSFLEADDKLKLAYDEIERLNQRVATLELHCAGLLNEKAEAIKMAKRAQKRSEILQARLDALQGPQEDIRLNAEVKGREEILHIKAGYPNSCSSMN
jgi:hypothetical protein